MLVDYMLHLIVHKEEQLSSKLIANHKLLLTSNTNVLLYQNNHNVNRIYRSVVPIMVKQVSTDSMCAVFNYILEWLFCSTDNPFSKEVRTMQQLIAHLTTKLSISYHNNNVHSSEEGEVMRSVRNIQGNFHALMTIYNNICKVSPKVVKKEVDIVAVWLH